MVAAIWTTSTDSTADLVEREIERLGLPYLRLDTDRYGERCNIEWQDGKSSFVSDGHVTPANALSAIYYRRPTISEVPRDERDFALHEVWYFMRAVLLNAENARWMNHPASVAAAENKLRQLAIARDIGLPVPPSILTSDPLQAWAFYREHPCVCKPGYAGRFDNEAGSHVVYAARVDDGLTQRDFEAVRASPTFLQREVRKIADVRLTVVGGEMFAARIRSSVPGRLDWRQDIGTNLAYERLAVPADVEGKVLQLMKGLDLVYGALDFAEEESGCWVFLEINPAGQWGWLQGDAGLPIAASIARWLSVQ